MAEESWRCVSFEDHVPGPILPSMTHHLHGPQVLRKIIHGAGIQPIERSAKRHAGGGGAQKGRRRPEMLYERWSGCETGIAWQRQGGDSGFEEIVSNGGREVYRGEGQNPIRKLSFMQCGRAGGTDCMWNPCICIR